MAKINAKKCCYKSRRPDPFGDMPEECQFIFEEHRLIHINQQHYCPLHLPMHMGKQHWSIEAKDEISTFIRQICAEAQEKKIETLDLSGIIFPVNFHGDTLKYIESNILLHDCQFHGGAYMAEMRRPRTTYIHSCTFNEHLELSLSRNIAVLGHCSFRKDCTFENTHFIIANFKSCEFPQHIRFDRTTFVGAAEFVGANFNDTVTFESASFEGGLWFSAGENRGKSNKNYLVATNFSNCTFKSVADFSDRRFLSATSFSGSTFDCPPKFHNSALHQDTDFSNAQFSDTASQGAARAYRTLKQEMERVRAWDTAGQFFELEQRSKIKESGISIPDKWLSLIYYLVSRYGNSPTRPLLAFAVTNLLFLGFYLALFIAPAISPTKKDFYSKFMGAIHFWLVQIVHPFSALKSPYEKYQDLDIPISFNVAILAALQSIAVLVITALFLLALRRRFKLD